MKKLYRLIGIFILIVILLKIDREKTLFQFSRLNFFHFALISLLILPEVFIKACRWRMLLKIQKIDYTLYDSFVSYLGGIFAGIITPGRVGEATRALYLKEDKGVSYTEGLASIFVDRLFDLYLLFLLSGIGILFFFRPGNSKSVFLVLSFFLFSVITAIFFLNKNIAEKIAKAGYNSMASGFDNKLFGGRFRFFFGEVKKITSHRIVMPFFLTVCVYVLYFYQCYLLAGLASIKITFLAVVSFVSISTIVSLLPITILGLGTREACIIYLFSLIGINSENAMVFSFLLFMSFYVVSGLLAFCGWLAKGTKKLTIKMDLV